MNIEYDVGGKINKKEKKKKKEINKVKLIATDAKRVRDVDPWRSPCRMLVRT